MKLFLGSSLVFATTILFLAGCDPDNESHRPAQKKPGGYNGPAHHEAPDNGGGEIPPVEPAPGDPEKPREKKERPPQSPESAPTKKETPPPASGNPEYGKAVPGKPGFVTSPYAPYQGYVDVRGYAPGTEVKDPYTGKIFLVPAQ